MAPPVLMMPLPLMPLPAWALALHVAFAREQQRIVFARAPAEARPLRGEQPPLVSLAPLPPAVLVVCEPNPL